MTTRTKTFFEDLFVLFLIALFIYAIYSFLFSEDEVEQKIENKTTIENKINDENFSKPEIEESNNAILEESKEEVNKFDENLIEEENVENIRLNSEENKPEEVEKKEEEIKEVSSIILTEDERKTKLKSYFQSIEEKIYNNIKTNYDSSTFKTGEFVNIRVTILENGEYEQLTFMSGNKEYFNLIKNSIYKIFPYKMEDSIKNNFPRYFRMKIEF